MKGCQQVWLATRVGLLALACAAALSCSSDEEDEAKPRIDGRVALAASDANPVGQPGVKVTLLRGDVKQAFEKAYRSTPEAKARRALIASLEDARWQKNTAYERARAALASLDLPAIGSEPTECATAVEERLAEAGSELLSYIRSVSTGVDSLDLSATDVSVTLRKLEEKSRQEEDRELNSLVEAYQSRHLDLQTSVLYDGRGPSWDRLCWRVSNDGHLNLASALLSITYDGRRLPIETARFLWKIGNSLVLDFEARDSLGETVYGIEAGGTAKGCFFAADRGGLTEHREWLESQGLTSLLSPRSGEWRFTFESVSVTRAPRVETTDHGTSTSYRLFPPQPLEVVFAPELMARRSTFRAQVLLDKIKRSPAGSAWEHARKASSACRTVVEMESDLRRLDEKLASLRNWADADPVTEGRVTIVLEEMGGAAEQDLTGAEETLARIIEEQRWAEETTGSDGTFDFPDLPPDIYSLLARHEAESLGWLQVVPVSQPVTVTLRRDNAVRASLAKVLARLD